MLVFDLALHRDIRVNELGTPLNCQSNHAFGIDSKSPRNMLADEGDKPMSAIVEEYANDQNLWAEHFKDALHRMLANGVPEGQLVENFKFTGISCSHPFLPGGAHHKYVCRRTQTSGVSSCENASGSGLSADRASGEQQLAHHLVNCDRHHPCSLVYRNKVGI